VIIPPEQLPIEQYHKSAPGWWSKTSLRYYQERGPAWTKLWLDGQVQAHKPEGVDAGLALDCYLTEGAEAFNKRFPRLPASAPKKPTKAQREAMRPSRETIEAIRWWDEWNAAHEGCIILSEEDRCILFEAVDAVRRLPCWPDVERCSAQTTVRRRSEALDFGLQSRPDWLSASTGRLYDLKKTRKLSIFGKQAIDLGYHLQAAVAGWCLAGDGIQIERASLIAVEWERGARAREYVIPHAALVAGDTAMRELAADIADRMARNDWTDRQAEAEPLAIPEYILRKMESA
jgi:hypothetical protein